LYKDGRREKLPVPDFGLTVFPEEVVDLVNPSWSPDGKTIAWDAAHIDGFNLTALVFYDVPSKTFREVLRFQPYYWNITICVCDMWYKRPSAWSPDGRYFAYTVDESVDRPTSTNSNMFLEEHATLRVFDKQGKVMFSMKDADWKLAWSPDGKWLAFYASDRNIYSMRVYILRVDEWKAYKVDLPFERVRLEGWVNPQP
jgi:Tol biopolymer transport system component